MLPPTIELYTEEPCPGPSCQRCRELDQRTREIAFSGARRALNRSMGPFRKSPPIQIRHKPCHEAEDPVMCQEKLPQLHVDHDPVLVGGHWTEAEVRQAVEMAIERARGPAEQPAG